MVAACAVAAAAAATPAGGGGCLAGVGGWRLGGTGGGLVTVDPSASAQASFAGHAGSGELTCGSESEAKSSLAATTGSGVSDLGPRQLEPALAARFVTCGGTSTASDVASVSRTASGADGEPPGRGGGGTRGNGRFSAVVVAVCLWMAFSARSMACSAAAMTSPSLSESTSSLSASHDVVARNESNGSSLMNSAPVVPGSPWSSPRTPSSSSRSPSRCV
jgi:hypothetical protein